MKLPYDIDAETNLVGALLIDASQHPLVRPFVEVEDFYDRQLGAWYQAIDEVVSAGQAVDPVTVCAKLNGQGDLNEIVALINATANCTHAPEYAEIVREKAARRRLIAAASKVVKSGWDEKLDIAEAQAQAEAAVLQARRNGHDRTNSIKIVADGLYEQVNEWQENPMQPWEVRGISTGIQTLDKAIGGLQSGDYLIAARTSMGKTSLILQMVEATAAKGLRVILFVMEMSAEEILGRIVANISGVSLEKLRRNAVSDERYTDVINAIGIAADWPLTIVDRSTLRPPDVLAEARRTWARYGELGLVFVDGLQLMTPTKQHEKHINDVGSISREMKRIQRELDIPFVLTHQLNRACETRSDKRPLLADLRDCGNLEEDADVVLMLYREGYYKPDSPDRNIAEILVRKNRLGPLPEYAVRCYWQSETGRFVDLDNHRREEQ